MPCGRVSNHCGASRVSDLSPLLNRFAPGWPASVDCDAGWHPILVSLDKAMAEVDPDYTLEQVKEKFGGLRYYYQPSRDDVRGRLDILVRGAELTCAVTCEVTGQPGRLMQKGGQRKTLSAYYIVEGWKPNE